MRSLRARHYPYLFSVVFIILALALVACGNNDTSTKKPTKESPPTTVKLGYFPNITHAVALVGVDRGTFKQALEKNTLQTTLYNAGPALISALLAGDIDIGYVGPNPAVNGYIQSHGEALRIIAGAASGGASLIVRPDAHITSAKDLSGKKLATPQLGGTQDISLRHYLQENKLQADNQGGTVQIIPTDNSNILNLFKQGQIDGAWVPEPWASRLIKEGNGTLFVDERTLWPNKKFVTTNVVVRKAFLDQYPDVVDKFLQAHVETVQYINAHLDDAKRSVNNQIQAQPGGKPLAQDVLDQAFKNLDITYDPLAKTLFKAADDAYALGFLKSKPDKKIYYLDPLNNILSSKGLAKVSAS